MGCVSAVCRPFCGCWVCLFVQYIMFNIGRTCLTINSIFFVYKSWKHSVLNVKFLFPMNKNKERTKKLYFTKYLGSHNKLTNTNDLFFQSLNNQIWKVCFKKWQALNLKKLLAQMNWHRKENVSKDGEPRCWTHVHLEKLSD